MFLTETIFEKLKSTNAHYYLFSIQMTSMKLIIHYLYENILKNNTS